MLIRFLQIRRAITALLITVIGLLPVFVTAQDLVPISSITGSSSVFVFRSVARQVKRTVSRPTRTKAQKAESSTKIRRQYQAIAKNDRSKILDPNNLPPNARTMAADKGSKLFSGVGEYYIEKGEFDRAIEFFTDAVSLDANNIDAKKGMSEALALKGAYLLEHDQAPAAKSIFLEALKFDPKNSSANFGLGEIFSDLDQYQEAIARYESSLASDAGLTEIYVPLGILYFQIGEIAKADELLTKGLASSAGSAQTQFFLGLVRTSQNRLSDALAAFQKAKTIDPEYPEAFFNTGETLAKLDRPVDAIPEYQRAVSLKADYFDAWIGLGESQYQVQRYADAIVSFEAAAKLKNDSWQAYAGWGDSLLKAGKFAEAAAKHNLAALFLTRTPGFDKTTAADLYSKVGYSYGQQCEINMTLFKACQWSAAIKALENATALTSDSIDYSNLGWAYFNASRVDLLDRKTADQQAKLALAKEALLKVTSTDPVVVESAQQNLGAVLNDLGDYRGAVDALKIVFDKHPDWTFSGYALGTAYYLINDYDNAASTLRKVIDRGPGPHYVPSLKNLGAVEIKRKNGKEVKKIVEELKRISLPDALALERDMKAARL